MNILKFASLVVEIYKAIPDIAIMEFDKRRPPDQRNTLEKLTARGTSRLWIAPRTLFRLPFKLADNTSQCLSTLDIMIECGDIPKRELPPIPDHIKNVEIIAHTPDAIFAVEMREEAIRMQGRAVNNYYCNSKTFF